MSDPDYGAGEGRLIGRAELLGTAVSVVWLGIAIAVLAGGEGTPGQILAIVGALLPVGLIWVVLAMLRVTRSLRAEAGRVHAALDELRAGAGSGEVPLPMDQPPMADISTADIEERLEALLVAQARIEAALARMLAQDVKAERAAPYPAEPTPPGLAERAQPWVAQGEEAADGRPALSDAAAPDQAPAEAQPVLALGTPDGASSGIRAPVTVDDFLRALNFPDTVDDRAGFDALRAGLADPRAARVIRAAQDVLTLLSEDGIYMDDLMPPPRLPEAELWRRFARGERGRSVAGLGGVEDPASLERTAARMREDAVFRDVAHHFLRHFDRMIEALEPNVTDAELAQLAETRSARAFMLLGRVSGSFG